MIFLSAFSSCPNDTFIFEALINKRINTDAYKFEPYISDIEDLNNMANENTADIIKLSYFAFFKNISKYIMINSGAALGNNCGPLVVSKYKIYPDELYDCKIAIPGFNTTAFLLMNIFFPELNKKKNFFKYTFSDIEDVVLQNEADAGLIIHESRFTYHKKGLKLIADLGELWHKKYNLPIPLGGIAVKRELSKEIQNKIDNYIHQSINYSFNNNKHLNKFIKEHSQIKSDDLIKSHIDLYVNKYSVNLGKTGKEAIHKLYSEALKLKLIEDNKNKYDLFID